MSPIVVAQDGSVAIVKIDRPQRLNAVTPPVMAELADRLQAIEGDAEIGAVVLTGAGRAFCVGGDVKDMSERPTRNFEGRVADLTHMHRVPRLIRSMPKIVVAAVNGPAMGAGLTLAAACDIRIAAETAVFRTAFDAVGLSGDMGGSHTLPRLIGPMLARDLYFTSRLINAAEALRIGLVSRVVPQEDCVTAAIAVAKSIADGPRVAYGYMKRNMLAAESEPFERVLDLEALHQQRCAETADHAEAKRAFAEKRAPVFEGR